VLPLRGARAAPVAANAPAPQPVVAAPDPAFERRMAELEAQVVAQEAMLRRALTMLVDWVEADGQSKAYRTHAA
jgi:general secretion pathway protein A